MLISAGEGGFEVVDLFIDMICDLIKIITTTQLIRTVRTAGVVKCDG